MPRQAGSNELQIATCRNQPESNGATLWRSVNDYRSLSEGRQASPQSSDAAAPDWRRGRPILDGWGDIIRE